MIKGLKQRYLNVTTGAYFFTALCVRLWRLDHLGLWLDEGATVHFAEQSLMHIWRDCFTHEPNPPLYYSFMHVWIAIFGDSEFMLRLPSAICGALTVALIFRIAAAWWSTWVGVLAATFALALPIQLQYSQEARSYALFSSLSLLSVYFTPIDLRLKSFWHGWLLFSFNVALLLTHFFSVWLLLAQALALSAVYIVRRRRGKNVPGAPAISKIIFGSILVGSPWYMNLAFNYGEFRQQVDWIDRYPYVNPLHFLEIYFGVAFLEEWSAPSWPIAGTAMALVVLSLIVRDFKPGSGPHFTTMKGIPVNTGFIGGWAFLSIILPLSIGIAGPRFFVLRYGLASASALYILVAALIKSRVADRALPFILFAIVTAQVFFATKYFGSAFKEDWRGAVRDMQQLDPRLQIAVFPKWYMTQKYYSFSVVDYYARRLLDPATIVTYLDSSEDAVQFLEKNHPAWFLMKAWFNDDVMKKDEVWKSVPVVDERRYQEVLLRKVNAP